MKILKILLIGLAFPGLSATTSRTLMEAKKKARLIVR
jgi:hypothetical protein